ncbi:group II intron maturase-specific domain-containing protein [Aquimarina muelleri]|uniref:group II intron maturase-specific domain-containing protein n=1 Tax=Aquimarina muelleri TaxID=279356 RepID=UPI003F684BA9
MHFIYVVNHRNVSFSFKSGYGNGSTQSQAEHILQRIKQRVKQCGLTLHPEKTKIVYCKDFKRQKQYREIKFDFLGYTFQPRTSKSKKTDKLFLGYDCAMSIQSISRIFETIRKMEIPRMRCDKIVGIAYHLNPKLRGWIRYFGKYRGYSLSKVFLCASYQIGKVGKV